MSDITTEGEDIINSLKNYNLNWISTENNESYNLLGGDLNNLNLITRNELLNTESLDSFLQNGGKVQNQKIIKGLRYENLLNNDNNNENGNISSDETEEMYGGKKNKPSPNDEFHQDAINYLKDDLQLSPLEARAYKSLAYHYIKENNKDATALERSKLMLSLIKSENFLQDFKEKLDETIKIIESIDLKKSKNSENKK